MIVEVKRTIRLLDPPIDFNLEEISAFNSLPVCIVSTLHWAFGNGLNHTSSRTDPMNTGT